MSERKREASKGDGTGTGTINLTIKNDTTTDSTTLGTTGTATTPSRKRAKIAQRQQERGYRIQVARDLSNDNSTVIFNVGGTKYQVSKSLLWKFPHSLLSIKLDEALNERNKNTIHNNEEGKKEPTTKGDESSSIISIFIDRDSKRFQYVLDWMRDGRVIIPIGIPKQAMIQELDYFGFGLYVTDIESTIDDSSVAPMLSEMCYNYAKAMKEQAEKARRKMKREESQLRMKECAFWCFNKIKFEPDSIICVDERVDEFANFYPIQPSFLKSSLKSYGLEISMHRIGDDALYYKIGRNIQKKTTEVGRT